MAQVETELKGAGLSQDAICAIMAAMQVRSLPDLASLLGEDNTAVQQLQRLFELAAGYGYSDWLVFDASIVRGLAYYTGLGQQPPQCRQHALSLVHIFVVLQHIKSMSGMLNQMCVDIEPSYVSFKDMLGIHS